MKQSKAITATTFDVATRSPVKDAIISAGMVDVRPRAVVSRVRIPAGITMSHAVGIATVMETVTTAMTVMEPLVSDAVQIG
jgi:hypothetical protein